MSNRKRGTTRKQKLIKKGQCIQSSVSRLNLRNELEMGLDTKTINPQKHWTPDSSTRSLLINSCSLIGTT